MKTIVRLLAGALALTLGVSSLSSGGPLPLQGSFFPPATTPQPRGQFGQSVAASADYIVIGAPATVFASEEEVGVVFVHSAATGALIATLKEPTPQSYTGFGNAVAVAGSRIVVGAPNFFNGERFAGAAYVYDLHSATPTVPVHALQNPDGMINYELFGSAVAISGNQVVVGAPYADFLQGVVHRFDLARAQPAQAVETIRNPDPGPRERFGQAVAISGNRIVIGAPGDTRNGGSVAGAGAAYVFTIGNPTPLALANPAPATGDEFGHAVTLDGARVVVGAPEEEVAGSRVGAVYAYDLASATPGTPTVVPNPTKPSLPFAGFGFAVALSGTRLAVGTRLEEQYPAAAPVHLYDLASPTPEVPVTTVRNPSPGFYDLFGEAVALAGDRLVVAAVYDDEAADDAGAVYAFDLAGATRTVPARSFHNLFPPLRELFGSAVALSETRLVVGAPGDNNSAYLFDLEAVPPTVPRFILKVPPPPPGTFSQGNVGFGEAVAIAGNFVVVGAPSFDSPGEDSGAAFVYDLGSADPTVPLTLTDPNPFEYDYFGTAVAASGSRVAIGVPQFDFPTQVVGGVVHIFDLASATPTVPVLTVQNPTPESNDLFGSAVALSGSRLVVGANLDNTGAPGAGSVYVFDLSSATPGTPVKVLHNPTPADFERFGRAVAVSGDRVVVGQDVYGVRAGAAYVYDLASATPTEPALSLSAPQPAPGDGFGFSVAIRGTRVVVGASARDINYRPSGAGFAFVYDLTSATPREPVEILDSPTPTPTDDFGFAVAVSENHVAVGAPGDDTINLDEGAAYVFGAPIGVPTPRIRVEQPAGTALPANGTALVDFTGVLLGSSASRTFTVRNVGTADLQVAASINSTVEGEFAITTAPAALLAPGSSTTVVVTFAPVSAGARTATLSLPSNAMPSPFVISLKGVGAAAGDTDGDGLSDLEEVNVHRTNPSLADTDGDLVNDGTEVNLALFGFDPLADSSGRRQLLRDNARGLELFRASDVQNLALGRPLLQRNASGSFTLRLGLERSPDLRTWTPLTGFSPTYDATSGEIFLEFGPGASGAEFYRVFGTRP